MCIITWGLQIKDEDFYQIKVKHFIHEWGHTVEIWLSLSFIITPIRGPKWHQHFQNSLILKYKVVCKCVVPAVWAPEGGCTRVQSRSVSVSVFMCFTQSRLGKA